MKLVDARLTWCESRVNEKQCERTPGTYFKAKCIVNRKVT